MPVEVLLAGRLPGGWVVENHGDAGLWRINESWRRSFAGTFLVSGGEAPVESAGWEKWGGLLTPGPECRRMGKHGESPDQSQENDQ